MLTFISELRSTHIKQYEKKRGEKESSSQELFSLLNGHSANGNSFKIFIPSSCAKLGMVPPGSANNRYQISRVNLLLTQRRFELRSGSPVMSELCRPQRAQSG